MMQAMSSAHPQPDNYLWKKFCCFFFIVECVIRPAIAVMLPVDLAGDEAYYWEWGQHLDWGYFSKPPGIAWLMAGAHWISPDSTIGIRFLACLLGFGGSWFVVLTAKRCFGIQPAVWVGAAWILTPANSALHLLLTIDAPLVFFWAMAIWAFREWIHTKGNSYKFGLLFGIALMGGILSKQMMLVFFPIVCLYLLLESNLRIYLLRPSLWVAFVIGHLGLVPPIWWNAQNNWITFQHTMHHFESASPGIGKSLSRFFELFGAELGLVSPVLFILLFISGFGVLKNWKKVSSDGRLFWWLSFPAILAMFFLTFRQRVNPNWPAVFLIGGTLLSGGYFWNKWETTKNSSKPARNWVRISVRVAAVFTICAYLALISVSTGVIKFPGFDPSARIRQWSSIATDVQSIVTRHQNDGTVSPEFFWVTIGHRFLTSELAYFLDSNPRVYRFSPEPDLLRSQHDLWPNPSSLIGQNGLIVVRGQPENLPDEINGYFEKLEVLEIHSNPDRREKWRTFSIFYGENLKFWPAKDLGVAKHQ